MNIKVKSLQEGGAFPFADYVPFMGMNLEKPSTNTAKEDSNDIGIKDLLSMVEKMEGLPSDMQSLVNSLTTLYKANPVGNPTQVKNLAITTYLSALLKVKTAKFNLDQFNHAYTEVVKNGGLNEVAINEHGYLYCMNAKGDKKLMSVQEYLNLDSLSDNIYLALTNANLLRYRAEAPDLAFTNDLLGIASNGIGLEYVTKLLNSIASSIGSEDISLEGYTKKLADLIVGGFQAILELITQDPSSLVFDGVYKTHLKTKDSQLQIALALVYTWNTLPENVKSWLLLKSDGTEKGALLLILTLLSSKELKVRDLKTIFLENLDLQGNKKPTKSDDDSLDYKTNLVLNIMDSRGGDKGTFTLNKGKQGTLEVPSVNYRSIVDHTGKTIQATSLSNMLAESGILGIVDNTSISFGDLLVKADSLDSIVYKNNGGSYVVLPCIRSNGKIVPDLDLLDLYEEVIDAVNRRLPDDPSKVTLAERKQIEAEELQKAGLWLLLNSDGTVNTDVFLRFFVCNGYASDKTMKIEDSDLLKEVTDDEEALTLVERALTTDKKNPYTLDRNEWYDFNGHDRVYSGSIFIPIVANNKLLAITAYGDLVKAQTGKYLDQAALAWERLNSIKTADSSLLDQEF